MSLGGNQAAGKNFQGRLLWSAGPRPAIREARGAGRLVSEEKLDPRAASAQLIAHRALSHGKRRGMKDWD